MALSEKIKSLRKKTGLSQTELSKQIDVSMTTIRRWESGERVPDADELLKLAVTLNTKVSYLVGETDTFPNLENVHATAVDHSIANVNGTVNASERVIVFEYGEGENKRRLVFPRETPGEIIAQAINAAIDRNFKDER
jgi:transcriptional regulator with XRE-family HTH domain